MKRFLIIILLFVGFSYAQDSTLVADEDLRFMKETYQETDSALTDCENLNSLYENRIFEYKGEVEALRDANAYADSVIVLKDAKDEKRKKQIEILNSEIKRQQVEIWLYRSGGIIILVAGALLLLN